MHKLFHALEYFVEGTLLLGSKVIFDRQVSKMRVRSLLRKTRNVFSGQHVCTHEKETLLARPAGKKGKVSSKCLYFFGYLTSLDKDSPIPEECLTCKEILECRDIWIT